MYTTIGISAEQLYGDIYAAWLRDTHEKNSNDTKRLFTSMVEDGFGDRVIVLRRQRLGANFTSSLVPLLHQTALTKLDLHGNVLRDVGCELLAHVIRDLPMLSHLDLGANALGSGLVVSGGGTSSTSSGAAGGNGSGSGGVTSGGVAAASSWPTTRGSGNGATGGGGHKVANSSSYLSAMQLLSAAIAQHKKLCVLILGSDAAETYANRIDVAGAVLLLEGCLLNRSLRTLDLSGNFFAAESPSALGGRPSGGTTDVSIASDRAGSDADASSKVSATPPRYSTKGVPRTPIELLGQLLRTSTSLEKLKLRSIGLTAAGAIHLLDCVGSSRSLTLLDISENSLPASVSDAAGQLLMDRAATVRSGAIGCMLQSFLFNENDPLDLQAIEQARRSSFGAGQASSAQGSRHVAKTRSMIHSASVALQADRGSASVSRQSGSLSAAGRGDGGGSDAMQLDPSMALPPSSQGLLLLSALGSDHYITFLSLDQCSLTDDAIFTLCRSLLSNVALHVLSLRRNQFSSEGVVQLGRVMFRHPRLERLFLSGNTIGDEGTCAVAAALRQKDSPLVELDIANTWLGDRGLIALGVALQTNVNLQELHLSGNHFTHAGGESFAAFLENNQHVTRCVLSATSVPHHIILRLERVIARNRQRLQDAEPDALRAEVVRLHYQNFKLDEAYHELDNLRDKNADLKRACENFDLQMKQDQSDLTKRIRELGEQVQNCSEQTERYEQQTEKLEADLAKAEEQFREDMEFAAQRLEAETQAREKVDVEYRQVQEELKFWMEKAPERETQKRQEIVDMIADKGQWSTQLVDYRSRVNEMRKSVRDLEVKAERVTNSASKKRASKGKKGTKA